MVNNYFLLIELFVIKIISLTKNIEINTYNIEYIYKILNKHTIYYIVIFIINFMISLL